MGKAAMCNQRFAVLGVAAVGAALLSACTVPPKERPVSDGHIQLDRSTAAKETATRGIPATVKRRGYVPTPEPAPPSETFTVVVNEVPVKELLFALARDSGVNIDVHPTIDGHVTLNAVEQTLAQILDRIEQQVNLRYEIRHGTLGIVPDGPFLRTYIVDYVNMARVANGTVETSTQVATTGGGGSTSAGRGNSSQTSVNNVSSHRVWETLTDSLRQMLAASRHSSEQAVADRPVLEAVIPNSEGGVMVVRATSRQHKIVESYLAQVQAALHRQVLVEATIVEIELSDRYQSGVDWGTLVMQAGQSGITLSQTLLGGFTGPSAGVTGLLLSVAGQGGANEQDLNLTVRLLKEFGETRVLSSPKIMVLNNQTAILKVVDNEVYFTVELEEREDTDSNTTTTEISTEVNTVPVGLVMSVTPQVSDSDIVTLNVRPTVTRIREFVDDPGVALIAANLGLQATNVVNRVPVVQVRETETVLRVVSRQTAVLGGLMQDRRTRSDDGTPGLSEIEDFGGIFRARDRRSVKTELVIFMRPTVVRSASLDGDLASFRSLLPRNLPRANGLSTPLVLP